MYFIRIITGGGKVVERKEEFSSKMVAYKEAIKLLMLHSKDSGKIYIKKL